MNEKRGNILIYDCSSEELMQLVSVMESMYELIDVPDGNECIDNAMEIQPDLILVDDMAIEPNSYDICHLLKANRSTEQIPIILMSDLSSDDLEDEVNFVGSDDYICRPIERDELLEKIDTLLSFRGTQAF